MAATTTNAISVRSTSFTMLLGNGAQSRTAGIGEALMPAAAVVVRNVHSKISTWTHNENC